MSGPDTSTEAVERLAVWLGSLCHPSGAHLDAAAMLRALAAERDTLREALRPFAHAGMRGEALRGAMEAAREAGADLGTLTGAPTWAALWAASGKTCWADFERAAAAWRVAVAYRAAQQGGGG